MFCRQDLKEVTPEEDHMKSTQDVKHPKAKACADYKAPCQSAKVKPLTDISFSNSCLLTDCT